MRTTSLTFGSMRAVNSLGLLAVASVLGAHAIGCSSDGAVSGGGTGGSHSGLAGSSSGGHAPSGGSPSSQGGDGSGGTATPIGGSGPSAAGSNATGGSSVAGSSATGGTGSGSAGSAGRGGASSGIAGSVGSGGSGSTANAKPSAGCSAKTPRPSGGKVEVANTSLHLFPESYDGTKPFPLLIALHACGNANTEFVNPTNNTAFATGYVRTFPNTPDSGQCWSSYTADASRILAQYDELMSKYCIDQNRVFAIAHSSGAQMLVNLLSHKSDAQHLNLKGVSPVAADPYSVALPTPVLYIDGIKDTQRSADSAKNTVAKFRTANSCMDSSKPYTAIMGCKSSDGPQVDPGCISYDGCSVPTIWCAHNDPSYSNTQHGIPCFAIKSMVDFFAGL